MEKPKKEEEPYFIKPSQVKREIKKALTKQREEFKEVASVENIEKLLHELMDKGYVVIISEDFNRLAQAIHNLIK